MSERTWPTFWRDQVVLVEWIDSFHSRGWDTVKEKLSENYSTGHCHSVGWVFEDSEDWLGISMGLSGNDSIDGLLRIPKVALRSVVALAEVKGSAKSALDLAILAKIAATEREVAKGISVEV